MIEIINPTTMQPFPSVIQGTTRCFGLPFNAAFAVRCNAPASHYGRVEFVISVDGRDTLTNAPSSPNLGGVVSDRAYVCPGFQVGPVGACSFVFVPKGNNTTTAERNDMADLCGVVVVAMYAERQMVAMRQPLSSLKSFGPTRGSGGAAAGHEVTNRLGEVAWSRSGLISQEVAEYDTIENWARRGVLIPQVHSSSPWGAPEVRFASKAGL